MSKRGRPTKFNNEIAEKVVKTLRTGVSRSTAARYCGISVQILNSWYKRKADFAQKCDEAISQVDVAAHKKEYDAILNGESWAVKSHLDREERRRSNRENMKLRREELLMKNGNEETAEETKTPSAFIEQLMKELSANEDGKNEDRTDGDVENP